MKYKIKYQLYFQLIKTKIKIEKFTQFLRSYNHDTYKITI